MKKSTIPVWGGGGQLQLEVLSCNDGKSSRHPETVLGLKKKRFFTLLRMTRFGFTLAEVLITLGIIGIIAAITMPALIAKVETGILKNKFKKVYSAYSQSLIKTIMDFDGNVDCFYPGDYRNAQGHLTECAEFFGVFAKSLKIVKKCENNAVFNGCIPEYGNYATGSCSALNGDYMSTNSAVYNLNDGSLFVLFQFYGITYPLIYIDINGKQGPNYPGKDVYVFSIHKYNGAYIFMMDEDKFSCFSEYAKDGYRSLVDINN